MIAQGCAADGDTVARPSKFVATGRGGLPPTPTEALGSDSVLADLGTSVHNQENRFSATPPNPTNSQSTPLVQAQGCDIGLSSPDSPSVPRHRSYSLANTY